MSKHTPGPWIHMAVPTSVGSCHKIGPFPNGQRVATFACVYADGHRLGIDDSNDAAQELAANARLIAAAPDLLEALKRCRFDSLNMTLADMEFIHAAIAKAEGVRNEPL